MPVLNARETNKRIRNLGIESAREPDFALREKSANLAYDWHSHSRHQLLYSLSGRIVLETASARWMLPPQRAAWIPARVRHKTRLDGAEIVSVYFRKIPAGLRVPDIRVMRASPLLREMLAHAPRWPASTSGKSRPDPAREAFFRALALLCVEWARDELPFRLPVSRDARIEKAAEYLRAHLDTASIEDAARFSGQSVRTLRRHFSPAMGMGWRTYRLHAAMLQAIDTLLNSDDSVLQVALSVGYDSPSAFSKAFAQFTGANPLVFRHRQMS